MQRRGGNIPPPPKEANRKYPIDEARDCPRGPAERRKRKKHKVKARFSVHFPRSGSVMLRLKSENLRSKLRRMPLLRALPPLAAGILLADHYVLPLWLLVGGFLVCGILALLADDRGANLATLGAILLFGMTVTELRHTPAPPTGTPGEYESSSGNASPNGKAKRPPAQRSAPGGTPQPENGSPPPETSWCDATLRPH